MELILRPWKLYADPGGRSRRSEFWLFFGIKYGVIAALLALGDGLSGLGLGAGFGWPMIVALVWILASFIPSCMVLVRRCHDFDVTGKLALATFIPYLGFLAVIVIGVIPGTKGENERGFDPREPQGEELGSVFS